MLRQELNSFKVAFRGLFHLFRFEKHAYFHLFASFVVIILGFWLKISSVEWAIIVLTIGLVICTEAINTAIEEWVNLMVKEYSQKAGLIKDLAAAAVLFAAVVAVVVGSIIFLPKVLAIW